jgi:ribosomal protein L37E
MNGTSHKLNNIKKWHPTECERCGRKLPKRAYKPVCATCIKQAKFMTELFTVLVDAGAKEIA